MGFGLLFLGYITVYLLSYAMVPRLIGYGLMIWGVIKLSDYNTKFKRCLWALYPLCVVGAYMLAAQIGRMASLTVGFLSGTVYNVVGCLEEALSMVLHYFLLLAICSIAKETNLPKVAYRSMRNLFLVGAAEVVYFVTIGIFSVSPDNQAGKVLLYCSFILRFLFVALNLILLVSCYRMICEEGDEDMQKVKEPKIPIFRKMEEVINRREQNAYDSARSFSEKRRQKKQKKAEEQKQKGRKKA